MTKIEDALIDGNPWWKNEADFAAIKDRELLNVIKPYLQMRQIIALTGLRRAGKTQVMLKLVCNYVASGFDPKNIIYFTFDEYKDAEIRDIIANFERIIGKNTKEGRYLLFLDEVQKLKGWQDKLKAFYDMHTNFKIFISGSQSLFISKFAKESLAGRIFSFIVKPLSFREFLEFKSKEVIAKNPTLYGRELLLEFDKFMRVQGFPELVDVSDQSVISKYINESIIDKVIYTDVPAIFDADPYVLESVLNILYEEPGSVITLEELAGEVKVARQTLSKYIFYLESTYLLRKVYNVSKSIRSTERSLKKYYPAAFSPKLAFSSEESIRGKAFESFLVSQLDAHYFWRDPYKNEVDIILKNGALKPIELKYGKIDYKGILNFSKKFNTKEGHILTRDVSENKAIGDIKITVEPAYKFLLELQKDASD